MANDVIEYLFFTRAMADEFAKVLQQHKLDYQELNESVQEAIVFQVDEGIDRAGCEVIVGAEDERSGIFHQRCQCLKQGVNRSGARDVVAGADHQVRIQGSQTGHEPQFEPLVRHQMNVRQMQHTDLGRP